MASSIAPAVSAAVISFRRSRPGSPWMPMPSSISSSPSVKLGLPLEGVVQEVRATP